MLCAPVHAKGLQKHMAISCFHRLLDHPHAAQTEARKVCHEGAHGEIILPLSSHRAKAMEKKRVRPDREGESMLNPRNLHHSLRMI